MLRIRFQRTGSKNTPTFRLVVAEKRKSAKGKFIEILGNYSPARNPAILVFEKDRVSEWIKKGAVPTDTAARVLARLGSMKNMEKYMDRYTKQKKKNPDDAPPASVSQAEKAPEPAAPKEEVKAHVEEVKPEEAPQEELKAPEEAKAKEPAKEESKEEDDKKGDNA